VLLHRTVARTYQDLARNRRAGSLRGRDFVANDGCSLAARSLDVEIQAVVLIRVERALPVISPAYDQGQTEEQVKDKMRFYWPKLCDGVEE
jgi:hypothetical protein